MNTANVQALPLPQGVVHETLVFADDVAAGRAHRARVGGQVSAQELAERPLADEADTGRVFFVVNREAPVTCDLTDFTLDEFTEREQRFRQSLRADLVQKVTLVLVRVLAFE